MNFTWLLSLILALCLGYYLDWIRRRLMKLEKSYEKKRTEAKKTPEQKESEKSTLIDPDDIVQQAQFEHEETMRKLNPQVYHDEE